MLVRVREANGYVLARVLSEAFSPEPLPTLMTGYCLVRTKLVPLEECVVEHRPKIADALAGRYRMKFPEPVLFEGQKGQRVTINIATYFIPWRDNSDVVMAAAVARFEHGAWLEISDVDHHILKELNKSAGIEECR